MNRFEQIVKRKAEQEGWTVLRRGWPDFFLVKGNKFLALEVKSGNAELSKYQSEMLFHLQRAGVQTWLEHEPLDRETFDSTLRQIEDCQRKYYVQDLPCYDGLGVS